MKVGKNEAWYYRDQYLLIPEAFADGTAFREALEKAEFPWSVQAYILKEDYGVRKIPCQQGICLAPYFISDFLVKPKEILIESADEVYFTEVELLDQQSYNNRLREVVSGYCPGCRQFGSLTKKDDSLNGHFDEITLDGLCLYRYETRQAPRVFFDGFEWFGHSLTNSFCKQDEAMWALDDLKFHFSLKYESGQILTEGEEKTLSLTVKKNNWLHTVLTEIVAEFVKAHVGSYHIKLNDPAKIGRDDLLTLLSPKKINSFRKDLKKYGVSIGVLEYDASKEETVTGSLAEMAEKSLMRVLFEEPGKKYCLFTGTGKALMALRFRSPLLEKCGAKITVYEAGKTTGYRIGLDLPVEFQELAPAEEPKVKKTPKKAAVSEKKYLLSYEQANGLIMHVDEMVSSQGCDHTLRFAKQWICDALGEERVEEIIEELHSMGGFCDCEVVLNCYEDYDIS